MDAARKRRTGGSWTNGGRWGVASLTCRRPHGRAWTCEEAGSRNRRSHTQRRTEPLPRGDPSSHVLTTAWRVHHRLHPSRPAARRRCDTSSSPCRAIVHPDIESTKRRRDRTASLQVRAHPITRSHRENLLLPRTSDYLPAWKPYSCWRMLRKGRRHFRPDGWAESSALELYLPPLSFLSTSSIPLRISPRRCSVSDHED